jgi:SAM-dependent methyltransferase
VAEQNAYQVADWNGQSGERWVAYQARLDSMVAVFGQAAIEAAAPAMGERVLDVGCGAGASSLALAARIGAGGQVLGARASERCTSAACIASASVVRAGAASPGHVLLRQTNTSSYRGKRLHAPIEKSSAGTTTLNKNVRFQASKRG